MKDKQIVNIFWTGGWDSTFRLLELSEYPVIIQPYYLYDENRKSVFYERKAMQDIKNRIEILSETKAHINDVIEFSVSEVVAKLDSEDIEKSFEILKKKYNLGIQYLWFALFCSYYDIKIEVGVVNQKNAKVGLAVENDGKTESIEEGCLKSRTYVIKDKKGKNDVHNIFGNLIFPILGKTKLDMKEIALEKNWLDIMELTWFCHAPINNEPCGICGPCNDAIEEHMWWRLPSVARKRNRFRKIYRIIEYLKLYFSKFAR